MENYQILMYLLFALAAIDLVVGVSNDAVNFLNSAIGSKVASFKTILIVASIGIIIGAFFSSGMMEVARKGIFIPSFFTFKSIMFVFLAVMLTDIILLDLYNTLGLPTSTTVSIVFELLGSAFMIGILISINRGGDIIFGDFIQFESAFRIIGGIFLSVLIAFTIGSLIQYFIRLAFTFNLDKTLQRYGAIFSGLAITAITYFLVIKGAKGSSFKEHLDFIIENTWIVVGVSFITWTVITALVMRFTNINPLKIIVLMGTFSLAMAFAGNDLVNFIGVAIAGKQAVMEWVAQGGTPELAETLKMSFLEEKQKTETPLLIAAGLIMVITLWLSAKAKKVTETEVGLSRQDEGDEKFRSNAISRGIVGIGMSLGDALGRLVGAELQEKMQERFLKESLQKKNIDERDAPAFDLVRASVNLMVASILISYATSLKMPLSTTYVSFMVAMGTSLADKAWGRESAVYRVAGVINVIGGWLMTALIAFTASAIFGLIIYYGEFPAIVGLATLAAFLLVRSHVSFKQKERENAASNELFAKPIDIENVIEESKINTARNLNTIRKTTSLSLKSLVGENKDILIRSSKQLDKLHAQNEKLQGKIIKYIRKMENGHKEAGRLYILVFDLMQDLSQSASYISSACTNHIINHHPIPTRDYLDVVIELDQKINYYLNNVIRSIEALEFDNHEVISRDKNKTIEFINNQIDNQVILIQNNSLGSRNGLLQTKILLESKDIITVTDTIYQLYVDYAKIPLDN